MVYENEEFGRLMEKLSRPFSSRRNSKKIW